VAAKKTRAGGDVTERSISLSGSRSWKSPVVRDDEWVIRCFSIFLETSVTREEPPAEARSIKIYRKRIPQSVRRRSGGGQARHADRGWQQGRRARFLSRRIATIPARPRYGKNCRKNLRVHTLDQFPAACRRGEAKLLQTQSPG